MAAMIKMNRNRQINLPAAIVTKLSLGEDRYFKVEVSGNRIVLTPVDPVERTFTDKDLDLFEEIFQKEKHLAKPVTKEWIKKAHGLK